MISYQIVEHGKPLRRAISETPRPKGTEVLMRFGVNQAGAYSTHPLVPHPKYLVDTAGIDDSFAATLACSAVTAYSAAGKLPELARTDGVAVLGCGGLGLVGISVLRAKGAKNIIGCDIDEAKLAAAANSALEDLKAGRIVGRVVLDFEGVAA